MRINHNLASLNTYRQMGTNSTNSQRSLEKLSSGLRINRAGDDAAGLAISEKMRSQIRGLDQASRNAQDGISMIQTSEGALAETQSILQRMKELATQSANGTNTSTDRNEIQKEMNQLSSEINRIGNTTEFNTQKLLKGTTAPVITTAATQTTVSAGVAGVTVGETSALNTTANSVKAVSSSATVQAQTSAATGAINSFSIGTNSKLGVKATLGLANGMNFTANCIGAAKNSMTITIEQKVTASCATSIALSGSTYTISVGTNADGSTVAATRGELYNAITNSADYATVLNTATGFKLSAPTTTAETITSVASTGTTTGGVDEVDGIYSFNLSDKFEEAGDKVTIGGKTFTAVFGTACVTNGEFSIGTADAICVVANQATALLTTLKDASQLGTRFCGTQCNTAGSCTVIYIQENVAAATGVDLAAPSVAGSGTNDKLIITDTYGRNLKTVTITQGVACLGCVATSAAVCGYTICSGSKTTALNGVTISYCTLTCTATNTLATSWDAATRTLSVSGGFCADITAAADVGAAVLSAVQTGLTNAGFSVGTMTVTAGAACSVACADSAFSGKTMSFSGGATTVTADTLAVDHNDGNLTIYLANATANKNTAAKIEAAIQAMGNEGGIDFSKYTATGVGNWDTATKGNSIIDATSTMIGGTMEVKGAYNFDVTKAFAVGDNVDIKGQIFKAVASGAIASNGEFDVGSGDLILQALSLRDAVSLNATFKTQYDISGSGTKIALTEKVGSGVDLKTTDLAVRATGTPGEYSVAAPTLLTNGAKFVIDGQEIVVSNKAEHVGYDNGTAIKEAAGVANQTNEIAAAINLNANLKNKYTASVASDGSLTITQKALYATDVAPVISTKSSDKGNFTSTFQVGANSGQSMTVEVQDMRAAALGITGDGTATTIKASNGFTASYVSTVNVTDGTTNTNKEYSLDVSTHDKATAAVGVLEDAIAAVSSQRSQLGAYQNRLEHTINNLGTSAENLTASESRIRDVDMAKEMMEFTKNNILSQAAQAMMAQANQQPQGVLQLLR